MLYRLARGVLKPIYYLYYNIRVEGKENLPANGPLIICANHYSTIDPIILAISLPYIINSMAKAELFKKIKFVTLHHLLNMKVGVVF